MLDHGASHFEVTDEKLLLEVSFFLHLLPFVVCFNLEPFGSIELAEF